MSQDEDTVVSKPVEIVPEFEATPPLRQAPMPTQVLAFWTPRMAVTAVLRSMIPPMRPVVQPAPIPVTRATPPAHVDG